MTTDLTIPSQDVVFLIPGLMATRLKIGGARAWLSRATVAAGNLGRLALSTEGGEDVTPDGIIPALYRPLIEHLRPNFKVIAFPYDWRRSAWETGARLAAEIRAELSRHDRPVHLLAHSTGGLAVRAMIAQDRDAWQQICRRGGRLVMLGTPNQGTYTALQLLSGTGRAAQMLALLNPTRSNLSVASLMRTFPGILELIPAENAALPDCDDNWWQGPEAQRLLADARRVLASLQAAIDPEHMRCIAGVSQRTPCGVRIDEAGKLRFLGSDEGDSIITPSQGSLPGVPTWYVAAAHGDIPRHPAVQQAAADLLTRGATIALPAARPASTASMVFELPANEPVLYPDEWQLLAAVLGATAPGRATLETFPLRVSVVHGSLEHARHPVAVGHYLGDVIVGAESFLNHRLHGRLTRRYDMNLYPGAAGTADAMLIEGCMPPGGLVVGLGEVGEITPEVVTRGVTEAALRLALEITERSSVKKDGQTWRSAAFSSVLIGTSGGRCLSIESSIAAIVKGAILANRILRERHLWDEVRIDQVEFIELYQDIATYAAHVVAHLGAHLRIVLEDRERTEPAVHLLSREGGLLERPASQYATGWWRRLQITEVAPSPGQPAKGAGAFQFVLLTDRARAEESLEPTQRALVDRLVESTIKDRFAQDLPATLYELLMPDSLKEQAYEAADMQLILDSRAAQYPWEMLAERDRNGSASPIAIRMGVLRQLKTPEFRARVQHARSSNALVIGEPHLDDKAPYPRLPGAAAEAHAVAEILRGNGYQDVVELVQEDATALRIMDALFAREYRVLHIAAHGIHDPAHPERSGVVIGDGMHLTSAELSKLRVVPELVFLNCCYLATIDQQAPPAAAPERDSTERAWSKLAASVSEELIKMGVRAVIAAGWAVDDTAGNFFASEFYTEMLARGQQFGQAVWNARRRTHQRYGASSNTWGAYQCYGEPGFSLARRTTTSTLVRREPVAAHEVIRELEEIRRRGASPDAHPADLGRARVLARTLPPDWRTGKVLCALGAAFAELGEFKEAIEYYEEALNSRGTYEEVPFQTLEQLANVKARYALVLRRRFREQQAAGALPPNTPDPNEAYRTKLLREARIELEHLIAIVRTPQRLAMIGGIFKRIAQAGQGAERGKALKRAQQCYREAHERQSGADVLKIDPYYTLNWVTFSWLSAGELTPSQSEELLGLIELCRQAVPEKAAHEPDFWARVHVPDAELLAALVEGSLEQRREEIIRLYQDTFRVGASRLERNSVSQHLDFLSEILEWRKRTRVANALRALRDAIAE